MVSYEVDSCLWSVSVIIEPATWNQPLMEPATYGTSHLSNQPLIEPATYRTSNLSNQPLIISMKYSVTVQVKSW